MKHYGKRIHDSIVPSYKEQFLRLCEVVSIVSLPYYVVMIRSSCVSLIILL